MSRAAYDEHMMALSTKSGVLLLAVSLLGGCCTAKQQTVKTTGATEVRRPPCPKEAPGLPQLPLQRPEHMIAEFWLARSNNPPGVLLETTAIAEHNRQVGTLTHEGWPAGRWNLQQRHADQQAITAHLQLQIKRLREAIQKGKRVLLDGSLPWELATTLQRRMLAAKPADELRVSHAGTPIRCYPTNEAIYDEPWQPAFDLLQCSQLRYGEPVRVLRKGPSFWYVWSSYTEGWVSPAALSPALSPEEAKAVLEPEAFVVIVSDRAAVRFDDDDVRIARLGGRLPRAAAAGATDGQIKVIAPTPGGMKTASVSSEDVATSYLPLRRELFLKEAFSLLDSPYGWGGMGGNRDCSRLLMDLFALFGVELPRNSWQQSNAGSQQIDVSELDDATKAAMIEKAARDNIVLLYLPGHIGLYLGRDGDQLYALHQFSGYQSVCEGGGLTMNRVNRTTVTALELGRGTKRRAFIERITRLVLFGTGLPGQG